MRLVRKSLPPLFLAALVPVLLSCTVMQADLLRAKVDRLKTAGRYEEAIRLQERALTIEEKSFGRDSLHVARMAHNLGRSYFQFRRYEKAEPHYQRTLAILEKALGPKHPQLAVVLNSLGDLYRAQRSWAKAEPLYRRALAVWERGEARGPQRLKWAAVVTVNFRGLIFNSLAKLYHAQGLYTKAEPLYRQALEIFEWDKAVGPEDPLVAGVLYNLGRLHSAQRRYAKAEPLLRRALTIAEKALGPDHPNIIKVLNNLARLYEKIGKREEAAALRERAKPMQERRTSAMLQEAKRLNDEAVRLYQTGRYAEAIPLAERSLGIREKGLGPKHRLVAKSLDNLAKLNEKLGNREKAAAFTARLKAIQEKKRTAELQEARRLDSEALQLYRARQYAEAEPIWRRALAIREKALGSKHRTVVNSLKNLARLYQAQAFVYQAKRQFDKAEPLYRRSLSLLEKAFTPEHPRLIVVLNNLIRLYRAQGRDEKAASLSARAKAIQEKKRTAELQEARRLDSEALQLYRSGQYAEAEPLFRRSLAIFDKRLGRDHPDIVTTLNNLAVLYNKLGKRKEAAALLARAKAMKERLAKRR